MISVTSTARKRNTDRRTDAERTTDRRPDRIATPTPSNTASAGRRHGFAVTTLLRWYRDDGCDVAAKMPLLSTYLGHVSPKNTYWYYSDSRVIPMPAPSCA